MIRRILIVEPDTKIANDMFLLFHFEFGRFEPERYEPEIAESLAEAVEQAQAIDFHCIIMDVNLPEMNGYEAIRLMKTMSKNAPIIMTTDKNTLELETRVREQNAYYYYIMSFDHDELKLAVDSVFENFEKAKVSRKIGKVATKPVMLKQLRLSDRQEKRDIATGDRSKLSRSLTSKK